MDEAKRTDVPTRHPATTGLLRWFEFGHLPHPLAVVSKEFADTAEWLVGRLPDGPELTTCLRKLLEAKDCAVRAAIEFADLEQAGLR